MAQLHRADRDVFHPSAQVFHLDILAKPERIIKQEEHTRHNVAHKRLTAKAKGETNHASTGNQRADINAQRGQCDHGDHDDNNREGKVLKQRQQRFNPR